MTPTITKIGLIQTAPLPGDFPNNLRAIVQGYRECLDHGAQIVIAPGAALCGLEPGNLATRRSFIEQTKAALEALSKELGSAPLLLAAYTLTVGDDELYIGIAGEDDNDPWMTNDRSILLTPYLLENDCVTELENCSTFDIDGTHFYVDTNDEELLPDVIADYMVRLPGTAWYASAAEDEHETRRWEASMGGSSVICCRPTGCIGGNIYGGGSAIYNNEGKVILRLPFFETAAKVADTQRYTEALHLPESAELMRSALERGIRDFVRNNCFSGVCLPLDHPYSALLGALCVDALGAANVCGISFESNKQLADTLGISCYMPKLNNLLENAGSIVEHEEQTVFEERMRTVLALTHAESRGLMLCCPLGRREIMLGEFRMYGKSGGHLAPLGSLYDIDIFMLSELYATRYPDIFGAMTNPPHGVTNRIIHEMADMNMPPSTLLNEERNYLFKENDVRLIQRKLTASAIKRTQLPVILQVAAPAQQLHFPLSHRMND